MIPEFKNNQMKNSTPPPKQKISSQVKLETFLERFRIGGIAQYLYQGTTVGLN